MQKIFILIFSYLFLAMAFPLDHQDQPKMGLEINQRAPQIVSTDVNGKPFDLKKAYTKGPIILVFYRGGW